MQGRKYLTSVEVKGDVSVGEFSYTQRKYFSSVAMGEFTRPQYSGKINKGRNEGPNKGEERSTRKGNEEISDHCINKRIISVLFHSVPLLSNPPAPPPLLLAAKE